MKHINISLILLFCICFSIGAQTLNQAKVDYKNKEYGKALPVFEAEYNAKPNDASLNLWYGICLVETGGDLKKAEECLLVASKRNLPDSYLYLGDLYRDEYKVTEARKFYDRYAKARPREKETTLGERYDKLNRLQRLISKTEDIQIIDSVVLDKSSFLSVYKLSSDAGSLSSPQTMLNLSPRLESVVYANGMGSKVYFGQDVEGKYVLSTMDKLLTGFGNEKVMDDDNFGLSGDTNYPFVMMDGTTVYFAGRDENGIGGYDIYVTRYNLNNNTYLNPELLNMPFNSTANDYMMAIDENKGIGWFATDRFQPEGKVCIYTFIPNDQFLAVEADEDTDKEKRARITSIKDTWKAGRNYSDLISIAKKEEQKAVQKIVDFTFIVTDDKVYHTYNDFRSTTARNIYSDFVKKKKELEGIEKELEEMREEYSKASASGKKTMTEHILSLEKEQSQIYDKVLQLEKEARNTEIKQMK